MDFNLNLKSIQAKFETNVMFSDFKNVRSTGIGVS